METPTSQKGEMLGVSRSGRIRKKSSKLMDFQSPDDIEPKPKKFYKKTSQHTPSTEDSENESDSEVESEDEDDGAEEDDDSSDNGVDPTVRKSLYMQEKSNKKKMLKDGKIVFGKNTRKDKGKSRVTAYMLWSQENRSNLKQTDLDFGSSPRRLAEMWANVPTQEKMVWRRKAKRVATKNQKFEPIKQRIQQQTENQNVISKTSPSILTRIPYTPTGNPVGRPPKKQLYPPEHNKIMSKKELDQKELQETLEETAFSIFQTSPVKNAQPIQPGVYKVTGLEPLDVAAHLNLLGESLSIIGERLKEHEGQITVSGSLSVLLDSLLCALGPLMCLTCAIPGVAADNDKKLRDNLHKTLDNIAYIMPGL